MLFYQRLFVIISAFALLLFTQSVLAEISMGEAINKAGRQRMLTQRIVKSYAQMGQDIRYLVAKKHLSDSIQLFESQLKELKNFSKQAETIRGLQLVEKLWDPVKSIATEEISRDKVEDLS